jgi:hypothetical protein
VEAQAECETSAIAFLVNEECWSADEIKEAAEWDCGEPRISYGSGRRGSTRWG